MLPLPNTEPLASEKRRILLIAAEPSLRSLVSTLLVTMGCSCTVLSYEELDAAFHREAFDAVVLDADDSLSAMESALLKIRETRPSLLTRILVIRSGLTDPQAVELIERHDLRQVSQETLLQQLWTALQELLESPHLLKMTSRNMHAAQMIFDSFRSRVCVRGLGMNSRQLAYQHANAIIDLLIAPREDSGRIAIAGQMLCTSRRRSNNCDLPVLLVSGMRTLARTSTNEFGEFHLEYTSTGDAFVEIRLREGGWVCLPLGKMDWITCWRSEG